MAVSNHPGSENAFEPGKCAMDARDGVEAAIEAQRLRGGVFVDAVRACMDR